MNDLYTRTEERRLYFRGGLATGVALTLAVVGLLTYVPLGL